MRKIVYYKNYFRDFFEAQNERVREKIDYVLFLITVAERIPVKFFKHIEGTEGLYEIRVECGGNIYRIFSCFDEGKLVVVFNGFQKKTEKTPQREIEKAERIMRVYFEDKKRR